jgi:ABC-type multidrug transport system ATPase subunit
MSTVSAYAFELDRVSRLFGSTAVLRRVSATVPRGAGVVLTGANGAGKSTLLRILAGLLPASAGTVRVLGEEPRAQLDRLAYMSHAPMLYDELTGLENLRYAATLAGERALEPAALLREVGLDPALPQRVGEYSQGMRQRAAFARALLSQPDLLLLDEPFSNLDAASAQQMVALLHTFLRTPALDGGARTLLLTTHQPELARSLADIALALNQGTLGASA